MRLFLTQLFLFLVVRAEAQLPPACPSNSTPPRDICQIACVYCDFVNGMESNNYNYSGTQVPGFCGTVENDQWIAFVAGDTAATFSALPQFCADGNGLQMALFSSCYGPPIDCYVGASGSGNVPVSVSANNLVIGQTYYLMIDGFAGDVCHFNVVVSPPTAVVPPAPEAPTTISGETVVCGNTDVEYCVPPISGAGAYTWTAPADALINGLPPPVTILSNQGGHCVSVTFGAASGDICVQGVTSCSSGAILCLPVLVDSIGGQSNVTLPDTSICAAYLPYISPWGDSITASGVYSGLSSNANCLKTYTQTVTVLTSVSATLPPISLCAGECITICGQDYCTSGQFQKNCPSNAGGCDSLLSFTVTVLNNQAAHTYLPDTLVCISDFPYTSPCGQVLNFADSYTCTYTSSIGCDSIVQRYVGVSNGSISYIPPVLTCGDECVQICGEEFCDFGFHQYTCQNTNGCDLNYYFFIVNYKPKAEILNGDVLSCPTLPVWLTSSPTGGFHQWTKNGQGIGIGNGVLARQYGTYILNVSLSYGSESCIASDTIVLSCPQPFAPNTPDAVFSKKSNATYTVQPSVSSGLYTITSKEPGIFIEKILVSDLHGRQLRQLTMEEGIQSFQLDLMAEPQGIYVLSVFFDGKWEQVKVVKM